MKALLAELVHNAIVHPAMAATRMAVLVARVVLKLALAADEAAVQAHDASGRVAWPEADYPRAP